MKDVLEKFGLNEFFAYLCPGVLLVCSSALWAAPGLNLLLGSKLEKHPLVVVLILVVVCYAFGLMITFWASNGADRYVRAYLNQKVDLDPLKFPEKLALWRLRLLHKVPVPRPTRATVDGQLRISEGLNQYAGLPGLSALKSPWDRLTIYRTIVTDRLGSRACTILAEAEAIHRRLLFALGVALALFLVALQASLLLALRSLRGMQPVAQWLKNLGLTYLDNWTALLVLAGLGFVASDLLRQVAGRLWEQELLLTCSLTRIDPLEASGDDR